jgi:competence protein ComEC
MYRQVPFSRLLLPFVAGILIALYFHIPLTPFQGTLTLLVFLSLTLISYFINFGWKYRWIYGIFISLFLVFAGIVLTLGYQTKSKLPDNSEAEMLVRILEPLEFRTSSQRALAQVTMIFQDDVWTHVGEKVMLYFSASDSLAQSLSYGSVLAISSKLSAPPEPLNPYQFNYREYLAKKQIHRVAFVPHDSWLLVNHQSNWLLSGAFNLRNRMLSLFQRVGIGGENLAVLSALTMGYKSLLDQETRRVFSASGAMHILAVSGLHVGILFSTLSAFLFFLGRIKRGKLVKAFILISFLWLFAIFTGLSPSVIRASLMFSLVIGGIAFSHSTNIYNTLSSSAFVILAINPMLITDVGFQLSYMAVISIVFFYPHFYKIIFIKNKWIDKIWVLICVSLAAQLGTFVLGLFYFNQFPNYFLLTNLYAIPLAFAILYLAIALIILSPIPFIAAGVGWLLDMTLSLLNFLIRFTEQIPFSTSSAISISTSQAIFLLTAIVFLALYLEYKKTKFVLGVLVFCLIFFIEQAYKSTILMSNYETIVFGQRQSTLVGFKEGNNFVLSTSDTLDLENWDNYSFSISGYLNKKGIGASKTIISIGEDISNLSAASGLVSQSNLVGQWYFFNNRSILIPLGEDYKYLDADSPFPVDMLLITNQPNIDLNRLLTLVNPTVIVVDATLPPWLLKSIEDELGALGIEYHLISKQGAYILR